MMKRTCFLICIFLLSGLELEVLSAETTLFEYALENGTSSASLRCRTEIGFALPLEEYRLDTCARCYFYLPQGAFSSPESKLMYDPFTALIFNPTTNESFAADPDNATLPVYQTFQSLIFAEKWVSCCKAAILCCEKMIRDPPPITDGLFCPRTWDGWQCWPDTAAGEDSRLPCQDHVYFMSERPPCPRYAVKTCGENGTWYMNDLKREWSNYSGCGRVEGIRRLQHFHIATYTVSILFLLPALFIFTTYKQLQVYRITMHKNLFIALLMNAAFAIAFKSVVILEELDNSGNQQTRLEENGVACKLLYLMTKYSRMTTYMWMFCEGLYLHRLIAAAFAEQKSIVMYYIIGWVFPIFPVGAFAVLRWFFADEQCWAVPAKLYEWITNSPNLLSLLLNLVFLCNIIRVLVTKLRATHKHEPSQFRKAVRATLVLVPLFGIHFFLVLYRPQSGECSTIEGYTFVSYAMDGLQGFLVSLIFCYLNGEYLHQMQEIEAIKREQVSKKEVMELLRRSFQRLRLRYSINVCPTSLTQLSNISDHHVPMAGDYRRPRIALDVCDLEPRGRWRKANGGRVTSEIF